MDIHQFFLGNSFDAHTYFGAHVTEEGVVFRTLAPNAAAVDLIWEGGEWEPMPMKKVHDGGVYELTVPEAVPGGGLRGQPGQPFLLPPGDRSRDRNPAHPHRTADHRTALPQGDSGGGSLPSAGH